MDTMRALERPEQEEPTDQQILDQASAKFFGDEWTRVPKWIADLSELPEDQLRAFCQDPDALVEWARLYER